MKTIPLFSDEDPQSSETSPYSVARLTGYIRDLLEGDHNLQNVWVEGEVSNLSRPASGHLYFTLKDNDAQLKAVMWRSDVERMGFDVQDHEQIIVAGKISVYDKGGNYQLYARKILPVGAGDLNRQLQLLHARLKEEGLFELHLKKPVPRMPLRIGIVTSASTAAYQDVLNVLRRRLPIAEIILSATPVQGNDAPPQIVAALQALNDYNQVDVILMVRGGGSLEDLWCFNDERVVRAVAYSKIPVVTGVGHEIDNTLVDFASAQRAPTPSAAAELVATPDILGIRAEMNIMLDRAYNALSTKLGDLEKYLHIQQRALKHLSPLGDIENARQRTDDLSARLELAIQNRLRSIRQELATEQASLRSNDPMGILARGYAVINRAGDGKRLTSSRDAAPGTGLIIQLHDGTLQATVKDRSAAKSSTPKKPKDSGKGSQELASV